MSGLREERFSLVGKTMCSTVDRCKGVMSETSQYFLAQLGDATPEVEARLIQWGDSCVEHQFVRDDRNCAALYFARGDGRTVRQMQSLLRTLTARWKMPLGQLEPGWLRVLTLDEFRACVPAAEPVSPAVAAAEGAGRSKCEAVEPSLASGGRGNTGELAQSCAAAYGEQPLAGHGAFLEQLPEGFDQRSLQALRAAVRAQTAG